MPLPAPSARPRSVPSTPPAADATSRALLRAAITCAAARGYAGFAVSDLLREAGISRQTFYARFASKQECFAAAVGALADGLLGQARVLVGNAAEPAERLRRLVTGLPRLAAEHPDESRVLLLESFAGGARTIERRFAAMDELVALAGGSPGVARAVLGATARGTLDALLAGDAGALRTLGGSLATWAVASSAEIDSTRLPDRGAAPSRRRGRAPGSLVPNGPDGTRRLRPGPRREPRTFVEHSQNDRLLDAVATIVAADGYDALTIRSLSAAAEVSSKAIYQLYPSLDEVFSATLLAGARGALAAALPASMAAADWREGLAMGLGALLVFFAEEPAFAKVALIDALSAGAAGAALQREALATLAAILANGYERAGSKVDEAVASAVAAGAFELCADRLRRGKAATLPGLAPLLVVLAVAPVTGGAEAIAFATALSGA